MITVYGRNTSTNVQKALWVLAELGLPFERIDKGGPFGGLDDPAYLALNPNGVIPTMVDGDLVIWESNAILRHYARTHPEAKLFPTDPLEALRADMMIDWNSNEIWNVLRPPFRMVAFDGGKRTDQAVVDGLKATEPYLDRLEMLLGGRTYVAGPAFTIADMPLAITMDRWRFMERDFERWPQIDAWHAKCRARPAYKAQVRDD
ncbi:MAG: glutathione S-transferase family protein [Pseudomonadota bacterium]